MLNASSPLNRDRFVKSPREILRATAHIHTHAHCTQWQMSEYAHCTRVYIYECNYILLLFFILPPFHYLPFHSECSVCIVVLLCAFVFGGKTVKIRSHHVLTPLERFTPHKYYDFGSSTNGFICIS